MKVQSQGYLQTISKGKFTGQIGGPHLLSDSEQLNLYVALTRLFTHLMPCSNETVLTRITVEQSQHLLQLQAEDISQMQNRWRVLNYNIKSKWFQQVLYPFGPKRQCHRGHGTICISVQTKWLQDWSTEQVQDTEQNVTFKTLEETERTGGFMLWAQTSGNVLYASGDKIFPVFTLMHAGMDRPMCNCSAAWLPACKAPRVWA